MTKPKNAPAELPRPPHGGSFIRDPKTGELECVERTKSEGASDDEAPAAETESGSEPADPSGGAASSESGSTTSDEEQEG